MGVLLGENLKGVYEITNSYAVPFDESHVKDGVWFLDHNYHETMFSMFRKINIKEKVLGWYVTGTTFKKHDLQINELFAQYCSDPILLVIDVKGKESIELPTKAFYSELKLNSRGMMERQFRNIPCSVSAYEAEEVGVEHLVREIKDLNMDSLQSKMASKVNSLVALQSKVKTIVKYMEDVEAGFRKPDKEILFIL